MLLNSASTDKNRLNELRNPQDSAKGLFIVIDAGALGLAGVNRSFLSLADDNYDYGRAPSRTLIVHRLDGLDVFRHAATRKS